MHILNYDYSAYEPKELTKEERKLVALWEEHTRHEFIDKDVEKTMATMTERPHIISVPTLMGGVGTQEVKHFYDHSFVHQMPEDIESILVSRTIGGQRLVDETILEFTHSVQMDWILPNIKPTFKKVSIALVAIVGFRDDKVEYEHIYWDQASVLLQIGLLAKGALPIVGREGAEKIASPKQT